MAFSLIGDGTVEIAVSFDESEVQRYVINWLQWTVAANNEEIYNSEIGTSNTEITFARYVDFSVEWYWGYISGLAAQVDQSLAWQQFEDTAGADQTVTLRGTVSQEESGNISASLGGADQTVTLRGTVSLETSGNVAIQPGTATVSLASSVSTEQSGNIIVQPGAVTVSLLGTVSQEASGPQSAQIGAATVTLIGTASQEASGGVSVQAGAATVSLLGTLSAELSGPQTAQAGAVTVSLSGTASQEAFGNIAVSLPGADQTVSLAGTASQEALGNISASFVEAQQPRQEGGGSLRRHVVSRETVSSTVTPRISREDADAMTEYLNRLDDARREVAQEPTKAKVKKARRIAQEVREFVVSLPDMRPSIEAERQALLNALEHARRLQDAERLARAIYNALAIAFRIEAMMIDEDDALIALLMSL